MEVGDYVRNKYGIAKVVDISNNNGIDIIEFDRDIAFLVNKETKKEHSKTKFLPLTNNVDIKKLKTSPRIIDLIEVGDYVNGELIIALRKDIKNERSIHMNSKDNLIFTDYDIANNWYYGIDTENIKSIVTKEMYSSVEYRVENN